MVNDPALSCHSGMVMRPPGEHPSGIAHLTGSSTKPQKELRVTMGRTNRVIRLMSQPTPTATSLAARSTNRSATSDENWVPTTAVA